jgi:hypothetical protein
VLSLPFHIKEFQMQPNATGLSGSLLFAPFDLDTLADARTLLLGTADASFAATTLDYGAGTGWGYTSVTDFLGRDATSLSDPALALSVDNMAMHLSGYIHLAAGTYRFDARTDDGFELSLGGQVLTAFEGQRAPKTSSGEITLEGGLYPIEVLYFDGKGGSVFDVQIARDGGIAQPVDPTRLFATPEDYFGAGMAFAAGAEGPLEVYEAVDPQAPAELRLVFSDTNEDTGIVLTDGVVVDAALVAGRPLSIVAVAVEGHSDAGLIDQVRFDFVGATMTRTQTENLVPYALFGDRKGDYHGSILGEGEHSISAEIRDSSGAVLATIGASFRIAPLATPVATVLSGDSLALEEDGQATLNVLANDSGEGLALIDATAGQGDVGILPDGSLTYTPGADFAGEDTIIYSVRDAAGTISHAEVAVAVAPVNDAPVANDDAGLMVTAGMAMDVTDQILANDTDAEGDALSLASVSNATGGTVSLENGRAIFTGTDNGPARFDYTITDAAGAVSERATVSLGVMAADDHGTHAHMNPHEEGGAMHAEHAALMALVPVEAASHVAVRDGDWFDPATWASGEVPGAGARVHIPGGVSVTHAGLSDAALFTLRVDGALTFAHDADSRMVIDTFVVTQTGKLTIGTEANPVSAAHSVEIEIAGNGPIDVAWDPMLLSRGLISHGEVEIHGAEKSTHGKVATDPMAGDTSITMAEAPTGWQVGDTIVIAGTRYDGYKWDNDIRGTRHYEAEDEVRTITSIDGTTVHFDAPLIHDHDAPRADLATSVANYSRSITVSGPEEASPSESGHVMFMHSDAIDVRYAAFHGLGRTDKSRDSVKVMDLDTVTSDSNVQGRYSFHLHRTGAEDGESPAMVVGNAVFGSPGWGFVHHDSNAILHDNASFDTFGAGFVAESGNETGVWSDNIAIYAKGVSWSAPKNAVELSTFDTGRTGDGFWFQGRMVESSGNIAASVNNGFVYFHRGNVDNGGPLSFDAASFDLPEALGWDDTVSPGKAPILHFRDNEAFAAKEGLHVVKANPNQGHDIHSIFDGFTAWSVKDGAHFEYTSHYTIRNFDLIAKEATRFSKSDDGISFGNNTSDMTVVNARIEGFEGAGINLNKKFTNSSLSPELHKYAVIDPVFINVANLYENYDPTLDRLLTSVDLQPGRFEIRLDAPLTYREGHPDPGARKVEISGTKFDSLGETSLPSGTDSYDAGMNEVIRVLEQDGYFQTPDGRNVFVLEDYYSDRVTGEIHKVAHFVEIDPNVPLGNPHHAYAGAKFNGLIDPANLAPVVSAPIGVPTGVETDALIDLLAFASDPDGDAVWVDGLIQPLNGKVFVQSDGTALYRPDIDFTGTDSFDYWVTDGFGAYTRATAIVTVDDFF